MPLVPSQRTGRSTALFLNAQRKRQQRLFAQGQDVPVNPTRIGLLPGDIDPGQEINRSLLFCCGSHPAGSPLLGVDLIKRRPATLLGSADLSADHPDIGWKSFNSPAAADLVFFRSAALRGIGESFSIGAYIAVDSAESNAMICCVPWFDPGWSSPFASLSWGREGTTSAGAEARWSDGNTLITVANTSGSDMWPDDTNGHWLVWTRMGTTHRFYFDGVKQGLDVTGDASTPVFNSDGSRDLFLFGRNDQNPGHNLNGKIYAISIWQRELSAAEVSALAANSTVQFIGGS